MKLSRYNRVILLVFAGLLALLYLYKQKAAKKTVEKNSSAKSTLIEPMPFRGREDKKNGIFKNEHQDYTGSISDFNKAIKINPNDTTSYYYRGHSKYKLKDYKGAIMDFTKAIELYPGNGLFYNSRGIAENDLQDYDDALKDFNKALELVPDDAEFYYYRGILKNNMKDKKGSCYDLSKAAALNYPEAEELLIKTCK